MASLNYRDRYLVRRIEEFLGSYTGQELLKQLLLNLLEQNSDVATLLRQIFQGLPISSQQVANILIQLLSTNNSITSAIDQIINQQITTPGTDTNNYLITEIENISQEITDSQVLTIVDAALKNPTSQTVADVIAIIQSQLADSSTISSQNVLILVANAVATAASPLYTAITNMIVAQMGSSPTNPLYQAVVGVMLYEITNNQSGPFATELKTIIDQEVLSDINAPLSPISQAITQLIQGALANDPGLISEIQTIVNNSFVKNPDLNLAIDAELHLQLTTAGSQTQTDVNALVDAEMYKQLDTNGTNSNTVVNSIANTVSLTNITDFVGIPGSSQLDTDMASYINNSASQSQAAVNSELHTQLTVAGGSQLQTDVQDLSVAAVHTQLTTNASTLQTDVIALIDSTPPPGLDGLVANLVNTTGTQTQDAINTEVSTQISKPKTSLYGAVSGTALVTVLTDMSNQGSSQIDPIIVSLINSTVNPSNSATQAAVTSIVHTDLTTVGNQLITDVQSIANTSIDQQLNTAGSTIQTDVNNLINAQLSSANANLNTAIDAELHKQLILAGSQAQTDVNTLINAQITSSNANLNTAIDTEAHKQLTTAGSQWQNDVIALINITDPTSLDANVSALINNPTSQTTTSLNSEIHGQLTIANSVLQTDVINLANGLLVAGNASLNTAVLAQVHTSLATNGSQLQQDVKSLSVQSVNTQLTTAGSTMQTNVNAIVDAEAHKQLTTVGSQLQNDVIALINTTDPTNLDANVSALITIATSQTSIDLIKQIDTELLNQFSATSPNFAVLSSDIGAMAGNQLLQTNLPTTFSQDLNAYINTNLLIASNSNLASIIDGRFISGNANFVAGVDSIFGDNAFNTATINAWQATYGSGSAPTAAFTNMVLAALSSASPVLPAGWSQSTHAITPTTGPYPSVVFQELVNNSRLNEGGRTSTTVTAQTVLTLVDVAITPAIVTNNYGDCPLIQSLGNMVTGDGSKLMNNEKSISKFDLFSYLSKSKFYVDCSKSNNTPLYLGKSGANLDASIVHDEFMAKSEEGFIDIPEDGAYKISYSLSMRSSMFGNVSSICEQFSDAKLIRSTTRSVNVTNDESLINNEFVAKFIKGKLKFSIKSQLKDLSIDEISLNIIKLS